MSQLKFDIDSGKFLNSTCDQGESGDEPEDLQSLQNCEYWQAVFGSDWSEGSPERISAVYACVNVIASAISCLPLKVYKSIDGGGRELAEASISDLFRNRPNELMTWKQLRECQLWNLLLKGNHFLRIYRTSGKVSEVVPAHEDHVNVKWSNSRKISYDISGSELKIDGKGLKKDQVAHFKGLATNGLEGISVIQNCKKVFAQATSMLKMGAKNSEQGGKINGIVSIPGSFKNDEKRKEARKSLDEAVRKSSAGNGFLMLESDAKFHATSMTLQDAQYIEQMKFSVEEIARIFNVPQHKIGNLDRATFNNIEVLNSEFYTATLLPWIERIEEVMNLTLLTEGERKQGMYFKHNVDSILRADIKTRSESYSKQITSGVMTPNEARELEERAPVDGGDKAYFPINHQPLDQPLNTEPKPTEPNED